MGFFRKKSRRAQAIIELAIFGSIIIFVLGSIIRRAVAFNYMQHGNLRAMRMALQLSYMTTHGLTCFGTNCGGTRGKGFSSRNFASVIVVEDRLTADPGRYGTVNRSPQVFQGGGTHTNNLQETTVYGEYENLPVMDLIVNGKHFPLTTSAFKTYYYAPSAEACRGLRMECPLSACTIECSNFTGVIIRNPTTGARIPICRAPMDINTVIVPEPSKNLTCTSEHCDEACENRDAAGRCQSPNCFWRDWDPYCATRRLPGSSCQNCDCIDNETIVNGVTITQSCSSSDVIGPPDLCAPTGYCDESGCATECCNPLRCVASGGTPVAELHVPLGCPRFYATEPNYLQSDYWCPNNESCINAVTGEATKVKPALNAFPIDCRFDLERDNRASFTSADFNMYTIACPTRADDSPSDDDVVNEDQRSYFTWQWRVVMGMSEGKENDWDSNSKVQRFLPGITDIPDGVTVDDDNNPATSCAGCLFVLGNPGEEVEWLLYGNENRSLDVDGDLKAETVLDVDADDFGVVRYVRVLDSQEGDFDGTLTTWDTRRGARQPGLDRDQTIYTFLNDGTVMRIEEGRLYDPADGQFLRTTQRKDQVDLIQRTFRLSNNTYRFCDPDGNVVQPGTTYGNQAGWVSAGNLRGITNPVEACAAASRGTSCFDAGNIVLTCMDIDENVIYIRSRIADSRGRKWITRMDDYE